MSWFANLLREDFDRYLDGRTLGARNACVTVLRNPGLQAVLVYRLGRLILARKRQAWWWPLLLLGGALYAFGAVLVRRCYGIRLFLSAHIGAGFSVGHFGGVEVRNCRLGERCSVGQQTKVGSSADAHGPQIGSGVWIGAHAKILTPITVGDGATIAPGARVTRNVPQKSLVVGDPARIVSRSYDNTSIQPKG